MCGPPDFEALHTCVTRLAELSAAGVTTCSVCMAASLCRRCRGKRGERDDGILCDVPGRLAVEGLSEQPDT